MSASLSSYGNSARIKSQPRFKRKNGWRAVTNYNWIVLISSRSYYRHWIRVSDAYYVLQHVALVWLMLDITLIDILSRNYHLKMTHSISQLCRVFGSGGLWGFLQGEVVLFWICLLTFALYMFWMAAVDIIQYIHWRNMYILTTS